MSDVHALDEPRLKRRIPELDGLRGTAILLVLVWHYLPVILADASPVLLHVVNSLIRFAWSGVDLFFVLSGFLLGGILLDNTESRHYFSTFYARRVYRILPVYVVVVACYVVLLQVNHPPAIAWLFERPMPLWSYLTFTQNFAMIRADAFGAQWLGATWSLAIEEQFYLVLPLIIRFIPNRFLGGALALFALAAPATRLLLFRTSSHWQTAAYMLMPARADALMLGALIAAALRRPEIRAMARTNRSTLYRLLGLLALAVMVMALMHETVNSPRMVLYGYSVIAMFYAALIVIAVTGGEREIIGRVLRSPWLGRVGIIAYGVYLMHLPILGLTGLLVQRPALMGVLALGSHVYPRRTVLAPFRETARADGPSASLLRFRRIGPALCNAEQVGPAAPRYDERGG